MKIPNPSTTNRGEGNDLNRKTEDQRGTARAQTAVLINDLIFPRSLCDFTLQALLPHTHTQSCPVLAAYACCFGTVLEPKHHEVKIADREPPKPWFRTPETENIVQVEV